VGMRYFDLEHPDVEHAQRTGFPRGAVEEVTEHYYCEECGCELNDNNIYEDESHEYLCEDCLIDLHFKW
jgi:hypothetical protein